MARRRGLRPEEQEIWDLVARTTRPMPGKTLPRPAEENASPPVTEPIQGLPRSLPALKAPPKPAPLQPFRLGARALPSPTGHDLAPTPGQMMSAGPVKMDAGKHKQMRRGKLDPEARLDLHGLTLAEAHPELIRFLMNAQSDGMRLVLVITGKGKDRDTGGPIPSRIGALRHQLPHWLRLPPLNHIVLQTSEAHLKHGGGGAFYIYLRRNR